MACSFSITNYNPSTLPPQTKKFGSVYPLWGLHSIEPLGGNERKQSLVEVMENDCIVTGIQRSIACVLCPVSCVLGPVIFNLGYFHILCAVIFFLKQVFIIVMV